LGLRLQRLLYRGPRGPFEDACSGIEHGEVLERWGSLQRSSYETTNAIHPSAAAYFRRAPTPQLGASGRMVMRECPGSGPVTVAITREIG
jgi:hypothetical protein